MVVYFRAKTGILHWSGTVGMGVFASGRAYYDEPAVAIMLCAFEEGGFRVFFGVRSPPAAEPSTRIRTPESPKTRQPPARPEARRRAASSDRAAAC
jgi:hypothetical protein